MSRAITIHERAVHVILFGLCGCRHTDDDDYDGKAMGTGRINVLSLNQLIHEVV